MACVFDHNHRYNRSYSSAIAPTPPRSQAYPLEPSSTPSASAALSVSKRRQPTKHKADASRIFSALLEAHQNAPLVEHPIIIRDVSPRAWEFFRDKYGQHPAFKTSKWEYENKKIIAIPLPMPFHDIAPTVMNEHIYFSLRDAMFDTRERIMSLRVNRENMAKRGTTGASSREPDCAIWTSSFNRGVVPTIIWEVGHSQKRTSLLRRAKMWCRRYNGNIRVVILLKYLRKNPLTDNSSILEVYRPLRRQDGKWTAVKDGPTYALFPPPLNADTPLDSIPLTYEDYFGPGNWGYESGGERIDPGKRFDLPLSLVRRRIEEVVAVTIERFAYRYHSGGSSVGDNMQVAVEDGGEDGEGEDETEQVEEGRGSPEVQDYEEFGDDWDAAMSDVSDA